MLVKKYQGFFEDLFGEDFHILSLYVTSESKNSETDETLIIHKDSSDIQSDPWNRWVCKSLYDIFLTKKHSNIDSEKLYHKKDGSWERHFEAEAKIYAFKEGRRTLKKMEKMLKYNISQGYTMDQLLGVMQRHWEDAYGGDLRLMISLNNRLDDDSYDEIELGLIVDKMLTEMKIIS